MKKEKNRETNSSLNLNLPFYKRFGLYFKEIFNLHDVLLLPNILCYLRLVLSVVYLVIYLYPNDLVSGEKLSADNFLFNSTLCGMLLLICGFTDFVDGFIARKFKLYSNLGKALDPTCDKILQLLIGIGFTIKVGVVHQVGSISWDWYYLFYIMLAIFILKEATLFFANIFLFKDGVILNGATWFGKLTTFVFYINMGLLVIFYYWFLSSNLIWLINFMVITNILFISIAYLMYFPVFKNALVSKKQKDVK